MRRVLVSLAVLALAIPGEALAFKRAQGDATLSLARARGVVLIVARGALIGRCDACTIVATEPNVGDGVVPVVRGATRERIVNAATTAYTGTELNFLVLGGRYRLRVSGTGIDISAAGRGSVLLAGEGPPDDGLYSLSGADCSTSRSDCQSLPDTATRYLFGSAVGG